MDQQERSGKLIVLSDLHLWGPEDTLYRGLLNFIDTRLSAGDKFFVVGDLFDLFVGGKTVFAERYDELIRRIKGLGAKDVEVYYIEGNHDFHLEGVFDDCTHVRVYSKSLHYEWNGRRFLFNHGDQVNASDYGYRVFRAMTRSFVSQLVFETLPGHVVDRMGRMMSKASRGHNPETPSPNDKVVQQFRNYACEQIANGYDFVIMGHSHYMDDMRFRVGNHEGQYVNVGYPRKHRRYLELRAGEPFFQLKSWEEVITPLRPVHIAEPK